MADAAPAPAPKQLSEHEKLGARIKMIKVTESYHLHMAALRDLQALQKKCSHQTPNKFGECHDCYLNVNISTGKFRVT